MTNHISAEKRDRQSKKKRLRNRKLKKQLSNSLKTIFKDLSKENYIQQNRLAQIVISSIASKGVIHKKQSSRRISRIMKKSNKMFIS